MVYDRCFALVEIGITPGEGSLMNRVIKALPPNKENIVGIRSIPLVFESYYSMSSESEDDAYSLLIYVEGEVEEENLERTWRASWEVDEHSGDGWSIRITGIREDLAEKYQAMLESEGWEFVEERDYENGFELIFQREWTDNTEEDIAREDTYQTSRLTFIPAQDVI